MTSRAVHIFTRISACEQAHDATGDEMIGKWGKSVHSPSETSSRWLHAPVARAMISSRISAADSPD